MPREYPPFTGGIPALCEKVEVFGQQCECFSHECPVLAICPLSAVNPAPALPLTTDSL